MPNLWTSLLALVAVIALIPLSLWAMRRTGMGVGRGSDLLHVVAQLPLSASQRVAVVELRYGQTARWLVLGVSPGRVDALGALDAPPEVPPEVVQPHTGTVDQLINRWRRGEA